ncbi:rubredoxin [Geobacter sulfurreducens]|uniref:rubredoxin n=1 Tax=Geobacter sulfurreducens TaxID=35554 RepID=UPI002B782CA3|nr:rubredoxin [Geobacter sulfurreducens]HML79211.1 rubredoxin [Geobacter sulfurreducens]
MQRWTCTVCQHVYDPFVGDPLNGVPPETPFEELPEEWVCPVCGVAKNMFVPA